MLSNSNALKIFKLTVSIVKNKQKKHDNALKFNKFRFNPIPCQKSDCLLTNHRQMSHQH